jgi:hypothetical protein
MLAKTWEQFFLQNKLYNAEKQGINFVLHWQLLNVRLTAVEKIYRVPQKEIQGTLKYGRRNHIFKEV